ncbi:MAG: copper ion binding protein, partial [Desulfobacterales bacterium]
MPEQKITLPITGMTCANCAMNIESHVKKLHGVMEVSVNFASEQAAIHFDPRALTVKDLVDNIHRSGYTVATAKIELPITGMSCANCAANIERALYKKTTGIVTASVNFATERLTAEYISGVTSVDNMVSVIQQAGYGAILPDETDDGQDAEQAARDAEIKDQTRKFVLGAIFALPLFILSMGRDFNVLGLWSHGLWV